MALEIGSVVEYINELFYYSGINEKGFHRLSVKKNNIGYVIGDIEEKNIDSFKKLNIAPEWVEYVGKDVYVWNGIKRPENPQVRILLYFYKDKVITTYENHEKGIEVGSFDVQAWDYWSPLEIDTTYTTEITLSD